MNLVGTLALGASALLVSPGALLAQEHGAEGGGGGLFSINPGLSVWTILVFVLLLFVLGRYAWGPILAAVDAREQRIQDTLDEAKQRHDDVQALLLQQRQELAKARQQAQQIVAESREAGERVRKEIEEKARAEGQALLTRARTEIERERDEALETIRRESVDLALAAAARLVGDRLDPERDRELAASYIDGLGAKREEVRA